MSLALSDRFPLLDQAGAEMLRRLQQHPHAPRFNYPCGERMTADHLQSVRDYAARLTHRQGWLPGQLPDWIPSHVAFCREHVPIYRRLPESSFFDLPTTDREDIRLQPWDFVPDTADLAELIVYRTSGTTGNLLQITSHPIAPNCYLPLIEVALAACGIEIEGGKQRVSLIHAAAQQSTYTLVSVMSYFHGAGFAKINLHPDPWNDPDDPVRFLNDCQPEVITGDPFALSQLAELPLSTRPKALVSSATALLPATRERLEQQFDCPVIDLYAMNESGPVAFARGGGHEILPHNLYVEILDAAGHPVAAGQRGEIVLTGGVNPNLPLLRYRTGDFAALHFPLPPAMPQLIDLEGRQPVQLIGLADEPVNSIEVTVALFKIPLPFFSLVQQDDRSLHFTTRCDALTEQLVRDSIISLFQQPPPLIIEQLSLERAWSGKRIQYRSQLPSP